MYQCGMKQMEERHVANQVDLMVWSDKLDLLAISNTKGEVQVHRLNWQKVWNLPPPKENLLVRAMAWRPDGKALAIGYSSGNVYVIDIEDKEVLEKNDLELESSEEFDDHKLYGITCLRWVVRSGNLEKATGYNMYDDTSIFLQDLPSQTAEYKSQDGEDNVKGFKELPDQTQLNMLLVGYGSGYIYMSVFGRFPYGTLNLNQVTKDECGEHKVLDINLSDDFSLMQVFYVDTSTNNLYVALINTSVLSAYAEEIFVVANKHSQVLHLLAYLQQAMFSVTEAWEHILLEMDAKMAVYAASVAEGGVSADLLELLMLGVPSDELELFLLQELTAKGLKKFGSSVELSYSTIQRLVLKQLNVVGQNMTYYLSELRGLSKVTDRYKILGLEEITLTNAIRACSAFLNKCLELQQVIDVSMRNYKSFFRWLFVVVVRLLDEQTPSEIVKITQQEQIHIVDFLYNFDNVQVENYDNPSEKQVRFNLERLGQYLQDKDLKILPSEEENSWHQLLKESCCLLKDNDVIFNLSEFKKFSLIQQQNYLIDTIHKVFDVKEKDIGKHFITLYNIRCYQDKSSTSDFNNIRVSQMYDSAQQRFMMAFLNTSVGNEGLCFMSAHIKEKSVATAIKYYFTSTLIPSLEMEAEEHNLTVLDLQFYSGEYLSVLVGHPHNAESTIFIQLPTKIALDNSNEFNIKSKSCVFSDKVSRRNLSPLLYPSVYQALEKLDGFRIAVSGGRKVAVVLSKSQRRVRIFEMEANCEDEEEDVFDNSSSSQAAV